MGFQIGKRPRIGPLGTVGGLPTPAYTAATKTASGKGADAGATVTVKVDGTTAGTATADGAGAWSYVFGTAPAAGAKITATAAVTSKAGVVPSAAPVLGALSLSPSSGTVNTAFSATISGQTSGSTITLSGAGAAGLSVSGSTVSGTPTATGAIDLVETLSGATGSPKTTAGAATISVAQALRIVGNLTRANYTADVTTAGNEARETRSVSYLGRQSVSEIWLVYCNWWCDLGAGGNETLTGNAVTLSAALEYNGVTVQAPNASLASPMTMADGATVEVGPFKASDFSLAAFPAQAQIFPRTRMVVAVGEKIPRAGQLLNQAPTSRKGMAASDPSQLAATGTFTAATNSNAGGPCMVVGKSATNDIAVLLLGDSIGEGNSDTQQILVGQGYFDRAANDVGGKKVPLAHMGRHGGTLSRLTLGGQTRRIAMAKYASHVFIEFGANDLFTATNHITNFQNNMRTVASALKNVNSSLKVYAVTVAPRVQSSDKFMTLAGQISQGSWDDAAIKTNINDWMKNTLTAESALAGVFDVNAAWSDGGGNAKWKVDGTAYYGIPYGEGPGVVNPTGTGTITAATNSATVTGSGTAFTTEAAVGRFVYVGSGSSAIYLGRVLSIQSDTSLTLEANSQNARTNSAYNISTAQLGTHPGPQLNVLAGTALATYLGALSA